MWSAPSRRVALLVKEDEAPDQITVILFGAETEVAHPRDSADLLQKSSFIHDCQAWGF